MCIPTPSEETHANTPPTATGPPSRSNALIQAILNNSSITLFNQKTDIGGDVTTNNGGSTVVGLVGTPLQAAASAVPSKRPPFELKDPVHPFIGRDQQLAAIMTNLLAGFIVILNGPSRVGKTELTIKYAYEKFNDYEHILFLKASTEKKLEKSVKGLYAHVINLRNVNHVLPRTCSTCELLSHLTNVDRYASDFTLNSLMGRAYVMLANEKVLFIIDDAPDYESIEMLLPYSRIASENHHFIVTSPSKASEWHNNRNRPLHIIPLEKFTQAEAILYVEPMLANVGESQDEILKDLANAMSCLPGDLQEAVAWIKREYNETQETLDNCIAAYIKTPQIVRRTTYGPFRRTTLLLNASCTII